MTYKPQRALRSCRNEVAFSHCAYEIERVKGRAALDLRRGRARSY
jgi:hypothetical protein